MMQTGTLTIHEILQVLFQARNVFLINIFGEPMAFTPQSFDFLLEEQYLQTVHLHLPGGSCYKISPTGLDHIRQHQLDALCPPTQIARKV